MGFLNPINLLYAASIAVLVAIYLRSRARPTIEVSSLVLFEEVPAPVSRVRRIRTDLLFWLEVAALAALVMALAGFYVMGGPSSGTGRNRALVFDLGASMGAREGGQTRLELAKREAVGIISSSPPGDDFTVLGYALGARAIHASGPGRGALLTAVENLRPMAVASRSEALAAALMRLQTAGEIDVFSDRPLPPSVVRASGLAARLHFHRVGTPLGNLAIVSLDPGVRSSSPGRVVVKNLSPDTHDCELLVTRGDKTILVRTLLLGPNEQTSVSFGPLTAGGLVHARIVTGDPLLADNDRYALAPLGKADPVLVLSPSRSVRDDLARVLLAVNNDFIVTTADPATFKPSPQTDRRFRLAVMDDCFLNWVKADSILLIYPPRMARVEKGPLAGLRVGPSLDSARMLQDAAGDEGAQIGRVRIVRLPDWMTATVRGETQGAETTFPLAALGAIPDGRLGILAFDVGDHLLLNPDKLQALIATVNLVRRLAAPADIRVVSTGTYLTVPVNGPAKVVEPDGSVLTLKPDRWGRVRVRPMLAGHYRVETDGGTVNVYANYYDASESNLASAAAPRETVSRPAPAPAPAPVSGSEARPLAALLIALALVALIAESLILVGRALRWRAWNV